MNFSLFGYVIQIRQSTEIKDLATAVNKNTMKVEEAIQIVKDTRDQLVKAKAEILGRISQLENANGELTPEQAEAGANLRASVQDVDDIIPDAPKPPVEPPAPPQEPPKEDGGAATENGTGGGEPPKEEGSEGGGQG